jgi:SAM-dependent methyltransferase
MSVFGYYARYYDLLYKDKDYGGESDYVKNLLLRFGNNTATILELGCGTGKHAMLLAEKGYSVTGIDKSIEMLDAANARTKSSAELAIKFTAGDVRSVRLKEQFDAVISLFHVMSYQATNDDLASAFLTAKEHLNPGGIFVFDFWYGPAVLTDRPSVRVKRLEDDVISVTRIAEPELHLNKNSVDVNYQVMVEDKKTGLVNIVKETHTMRYLFLPEIDIFLSQCGMQMIHAEEWMTGRAPDASTWGICCVAKKG